VRGLIYVPILHSEADLGRMAEEVRRKFTEAFGAGAWDERRGAVDAMWEGLRAKLSALPLAWETVRLYQDGLPVCGREAEIVRDVAAAGSQNHRLLLELIARGARLMGTEDPALLVQEYRRVQAIVAAARAGVDDPAGAAARERDGQAILTARDAFMARRIDATLAEGETGIVFVGLLHRLEELLTGDFEVHHIIHNLPFGADPWRRMAEANDHGKR
jgi:hypothetical protein